MSRVTGDGLRRLYDLLEVSAEASPEEIKKAYRRLAKQFHPDLDRESDGSRFKEIQTAYDVLSDPQRRRAYDRGTDIGDIRAGPGVSWTGGFVRPFKPFEEVPRASVPPLDQFDLILTPTEAEQGRRTVIEIPIQARCVCEDAAFGGHCPICNGSGVRTVRYPLTLVVPPGARHGSRLAVTLPDGRNLSVRVQVTRSARSIFGVGD